MHSSLYLWSAVSVAAPFLLALGDTRVFCYYVEKMIVWLESPMISTWEIGIQSYNVLEKGQSFGRKAYIMWNSYKVHNILKSRSSLLYLPSNL